MQEGGTFSLISHPAQSCGGNFLPPVQYARGTSPYVAEKCISNSWELFLYVNKRYILTSPWSLGVVFLPARFSSMSAQFSFYMSVHIENTPPSAPWFCQVP